MDCFYCVDSCYAYIISIFQSKLKSAITFCLHIWKAWEWDEEKDNRGEGCGEEGRKKGDNDLDGSAVYLHVTLHANFHQLGWSFILCPRCMFEEHTLHMS